MNDQHITITMPIRLGKELGAALDLLDERLIGPVPACLVALDGLILQNTPGPIVMVGYDGQPMTGAFSRDLSPEEEAELDRVLDDINNPSPERLAEEARAERFREFCASKQEETNRGLEEWFEDYASKFQRDLAVYQRMRGNCLKAAFDEQEARA
ncbi:hypothetical protein [Pseudoclavibacter sp. AY1H1]|uniref:hypothetical protein n=1 Tax=Pseudoclavibacter sp. AY1H1 TaxID=2080584 RepID=UPI000CE8CFCD|nr:hypothetical protein [Pseudoclavibacter sp. AY1H1]PPF38543.1 hypothetical protein C5E05_05955 [Pseudoclavibacter sp. AY1H1]